MVDCLHQNGLTKIPRRRNLNGILVCAFDRIPFEHGLKSFLGRGFWEKLLPKPAETGAAIFLAAGRLTQLRCP
jgi:hypothetical protein